MSIVDRLHYGVLGPKPTMFILEQFEVRPRDEEPLHIRLIDEVSELWQPYAIDVRKESETFSTRERFWLERSARRALQQYLQGFDYALIVRPFEKDDSPRESAASTM